MPTTYVLRLEDRITSTQPTVPKHGTETEIEGYVFHWNIDLCATICTSGQQLQLINH